MIVLTSLLIVICAGLPLLAVAGQPTNVTAGRPPRIVEHLEDKWIRRRDSSSFALYCTADGVPQPTITWYKDGKQISAAQKPKHLSFSSTGILFETVSDSEVGTYLCNASNAYGSAVSQAKVEFATLSDDFQLYPENVKAKVDQIMELECRSPIGKPNPAISWKKNGSAIEASGRMQILDVGTLRITKVQKSDEGSYVCTAENTAGTRETPPVTVSVSEGPKLLSKPGNISVIENGEVLINCSASGDPQPVVIVSRTDRREIDSRARNTARGFLISQVRPSDDGVYKCRAHSEAGVVEAYFTVTVLTSPSFRAVPKDIIARVSTTVELPCVVTGQPLPIVYWSSKRVSNLLLPSQHTSDSRFLVNDDGKLVISNVEKSDEGVYTCIAMSVNGRAQTSATLSVDDSVNLPPVMVDTPQNLTILLGEPALLPCTCTGLNVHRQWLKDNVKIQLSQRVTLLRNGSLHITAVQPSDSGWYTCVLNNTVGTTSRSAHLLAHDFDKSYVAVGPSSLLPVRVAPTKPIFHLAESNIIEMIVNFNMSSINNGEIILAEYFSPQLGVDKWTGTTLVRTKNVYLVHNLTPDTDYYFVCRLPHSANIIGAASPVSDAMRTLSAIKVVEIDKEKLSWRSKEVNHLQLDVSESTSAKVSWQVASPTNPSIQWLYKFYIKVTPKTRSGERGEEREIVQRIIVSNKTLRASTIIEGLRPYTTYEVRVQVGYQDRRSQASSPIIFMTPEAAPDGAPLNVSVGWLSSEQLVAQWLAPRDELQNGRIVSYRGRLHCLPPRTIAGSVTQEQIAKAIIDGAACSDSRLANFTTETTTITLSGLDKSVRYVLQMAAATSAGIGRYSDALLIDGDNMQVFSFYSTPTPTVRLASVSRASVLRSGKSDAAQQEQEPPILMVVIIVVAVLVCVSVGVTIFLCRRRCRSPRASKSFVLPVQASSMSGATQLHRGKGDAVALHPLLHNKPDTSASVNNILEQQHRTAHMAALLTPNMIASGSSTMQQHAATYADSYALSAMANNMDVSDSSATQMRAYADSVLPAIVPIPPPKSATAQHQQAHGPFARQNGMFMNAAVFRPIAVHAMQDTYDTEYAPLLPVSPPHGSGGVEMSVSSQTQTQTAQSQRSSNLTQRNSVNLKNGTKHSSSSSSSSSHLNAAGRKLPGCNQSPQLMRVKDFLPPPPPPRDPHMLSPNSGLPSEPEMDLDAERECATSNPLHYQSTTSRGSSSSGAPQPSAAQVTPYASLMVNMFGSNGQLLGQWPSTAVTNGYTFTLSACARANDETACTNELEDATSRGEDTAEADEDEDEDEDESQQSDADLVDGPMDESDETSLMLQADSMLKHADAAGSSKRPRDADDHDQMPLVQMGKNTASLPMRRYAGAGGSALPQVLENQLLQQPSVNTFAPSNAPAGTYAQMHAAFAQQRASSPYSSDNSTYGIVLPTKPGSNFLLPAGQQPRPARKRRTQSASQKLGFPTSEGKVSPPATPDLNMNANANAHAHAPNTANMQLA